MGHAREAVEVAKTVVEVAELAWSTAEFIHHNKSNHPHTSSDELEDLRNENKRLKELLEQNLKLLDNISSSPCFLKDCPTDVSLFFTFDFPLSLLGLGSLCDSFLYFSNNLGLFYLA